MWINKGKKKNSLTQDKRDYENIHVVKFASI